MDILHDQDMHMNGKSPCKGMYSRKLLQNITAPELDRWVGAWNLQNLPQIHLPTSGAVVFCISFLLYMLFQGDLPFMRTSSSFRMSMLLVLGVLKFRPYLDIVKQEHIQDHKNHIVLCTLAHNTCSQDY